MQIGSHRARANWDEHLVVPMGKTPSELASLTHRHYGEFGCGRRLKASSIIVVIHVSSDASGHGSV